MYQVNRLQSVNVAVQNQYEMLLQKVEPIGRRKGNGIHTFTKSGIRNNWRVALRCRLDILNQNLPDYMLYKKRTKILIGVIE